MTKQKLILEFENKESFEKVKEKILLNLKKFKNYFSVKSVEWEK